MIVIVDYHCGNIKSIANMVDRLGYNVNISSKKKAVLDAEKVILPGVGNFEFAMESLAKLDLKEPLNDYVASGRPILGICLGAQLMTKSSEESSLPGFGWIEGTTKKFKVVDEGMKIPHMGWNQVTPVGDSRILQGITSEDRFYFAHSYHFEIDAGTAANTRYGYQFVSAFEKNQVSGVQFHPEKSHKYGIKLLSNFLE